MLITKLKQFFQRLPHQVRAGITTAIATFTTAFTLSATGWARDFLNAMLTQQTAPKISVLVSAAASAALGALTGLGNALYRYAQSQGWLGLNPVAGPRYGDSMAKNDHDAPNIMQVDPREVPIDLTDTVRFGDQSPPNG